MEKYVGSSKRKNRWDRLRSFLGETIRANRRDTPAFKADTRSAIDDVAINITSTVRAKVEAHGGIPEIEAIVNQEKPQD